jgi:uncharacterized protein YqjF (DUF2071 family)
MKTEHRPWPVSGRPWVMAQTWRDLLFAHWPAATEALRLLVPDALELDIFDGRAWVGVVPFRMTGIRPRGLPPLPWSSAFAELNVRTYVTVGGKPGVFFFSLDAANPVAVATARRWFHLPYMNATMSCRNEGEAIDYASRRTHRGAPAAEFRARYEPTGPATLAERGSLAHWLTERYCLYTLDRRGQVMRGEIHHAPWPLQPATAEIATNTMASAAGITLPAAPPVLHFARRLDVAIWLLRGALDG